MTDLLICGGDDETPFTLFGVNSLATSGVTGRDRKHFHPFSEGFKPFQTLSKLFFEKKVPPKVPPAKT
jgi:hypothetical protein